ncbi:early nodulin-like protein 2 [Senna tora]|uniref:Early nodulin-like protein 2 n=1 Tax=Senna tora TaxID=362788 RepID=A0A834TIS7_9FABA|nr:early nodulin-like protein 2 [Senna tora]
MGSESSRSLLFSFIVPLWLLMICTISLSSEAHKFNVGGKDGWVGSKPSDYYNHWAQKYRFHVNDTLYFKYKKGSDSVLVVNKEDYNSCTTTSPLQKMDGGDSSFRFNGSGPFYFISGTADHCVKGQRLIVVVMAARGTPPPPPPVAAAPQPSSPAAKSPAPSAGSPGSGSPQPSQEDDAAPAPAPSGSMRLGVGGSVGVVLGIIMILMTNIGGMV